MPPTPAQLLRSTGKSVDYIDARVASARDGLEARGLVADGADAAVIAIASLGSTRKIINALVESEAIPQQLSADDRARLASRTGLSEQDWASRTTVAESASTIARFLGLPAVHEDESAVPPVTADAKYPLFAHQRRAMREVLTNIAAGGPTLLHMPTGSGKTRTAMNIVCDTLRREEGMTVLWVATMKELLQQAASEFEKAWSHLGDRKELKIIHAYDSNQWSLSEIDDAILFATPQTLRSRAERLMRESQTSLYPLLSERVSLIVFDEAHQATATTYRELLERISQSVFPPVPVLGLSATPGRTYLGSDDDFALIDLFDGRKVTLNTSDGGYANPVDYLIGNQYLAQPEFRILGPIPDPKDNARTSAMSTADYLGFVTEATLDLIHEGHKRIIVFARSVEESDLTAAVLRSVGISAGAVSGQTPSDERDTTTREYKTESAAPKVLVNFGVFTAGFDAPRTSAVVIARPVRSLVAYSQMVGRGIRGLKAGGNAKAVIATVVDPSEPAYGSIAHAFTNWDQMWE